MKFLRLSLFCLLSSLAADPVVDFWSPYRAILAEGTLTTVWEWGGKTFLVGAFHYRKVLHDGRTPGWMGAMSNRLEGALPPTERSQALAFWANAHNYGALAEVLSRPLTAADGQVDEERRFLVIGGRLWSLSELEKKCLRPLHEPLLIYALHQGSVSGGRMPRDILHPATLAETLSSLARESLKSPLFLRPNPEGTRLRLTEAFAWSAGTDMVPVAAVISNAVVPYLPEGAKGPLAADIPYDGRLNQPEAVWGRLEALAMQEGHLHLRRLPVQDRRQTVSPSAKSNR